MRLRGRSIRFSTYGILRMWRPAAFRSEERRNRGARRDGERVHHRAEAFSKKWRTRPEGGGAGCGVRLPAAQRQEAHMAKSDHSQLMNAHEQERPQSL